MIEIILDAVNENVCCVGGGVRNGDGGYEDREGEGEEVEEVETHGGEVKLDYSY